MTPGELRKVVAGSDIYKMSLGRSARYQDEALKKGTLVFESEAEFDKAVISGDTAEIYRIGRNLKNASYPQAGAPDNAILVWRQTIETFRELPRNTLILHWEAKLDHLHWGLTGTEFHIDRKEVGAFGHLYIVYCRPLVGGWQKSSIGGVPLSNIHPKARDLSINMATLNRVKTDPDYFRALIMDRDTSEWEERPEWASEAKSRGWIAKDRESLLAEKRKLNLTPLVRETADYFADEIRRMATTAIQTAAYANGQTVLTTVKNKEIGFAREELEEEIAALLRDQKNCCALTGYEFTVDASNPHLRPSLDRKNSDLGYVSGNLQIVTRAANFYKSASDEGDWKLKAIAMEKMALAIQRKRRASRAG